MKYTIFFLFFTMVSFSHEVTFKKTKLAPFFSPIKTYAKIIQLSSQKENILSPFNGKLQNYYVKVKQEIKKGDKIALIQSNRLKTMTQEYLELKKQSQALQLQKDITQRLYNKGLVSHHSLSSSNQSLKTLLTKQNTLALELNKLGISTKKLLKSTDKFRVYAQNKGIVEKILLPPHSSVNSNTPLLTLVNPNNQYYAKAFISLKESGLICDTTEASLAINDQFYHTSFLKFLPKVDSKTQKVQALFKLKKEPKNLFLGAYLPIEIFTQSNQKAIKIDTSALTHFKGELVVFTKTSTHHQAIPYRLNVVHVLGYQEKSVFVTGLKPNQTYVAQGVYYVKSLLLNHLFNRNME